MPSSRSVGWGTKMKCSAPERRWTRSEHEFTAHRKYSMLLGRYMYLRFTALPVCMDLTTSELIRFPDRRNVEGASNPVPASYFCRRSHIQSSLSPTHTWSIDIAGGAYCYQHVARSTSLFVSCILSLTDIFQHRYRTTDTAESTTTTNSSNSSSTTATHLDVIYDLLVSKLDITISGACGPHRTQPLECYYPDHRSYTSDNSKKHAPIDLAMETVAPGGAPRLVDSAKGCAYRNDHQALVYDRDIVTTWRLPSLMAAYEVFF